MSVYVGKDVTITVQNPIEDDVSSQANGTQTVFTVSKTPISDRDMDGVPNEPAHVTVYVNGSTVTVSAVNDSTGQVTLASAPAQGSRVIIEYRYDSTPNIAQELTVEPGQEIEGIDGLGSDVIQQWALLLKEISGSIKEVYKQGSGLQLERVTKAKRESRYSQQFWTSGALGDFDGDTGNFSVDNQELLVANNNSGVMGLKTSVLAAFRDGVIKSKYDKNSSGDAGWVFRWDGVGYNNLYRVYIDGLLRLNIDRIKGGSTVNILQSAALSLPSGFFPVEIEFIDSKFVVDVNGSVFSVVDSDPLLISGKPGFYASFGQNDRFDDFQVWKETTPHEYGLVIKWDQAGSAVKVGLDKAVFPSGSIPSPKNKPVMIVTPFKAVTAKTIT